MAENFYFKNLDIIGMLDDMESNFAKDLDKLVKKYGGKILRDVKRKTPVGQYEDGKTGGTLRKNWNVENGELYVRIYNNTEYGLNI